MPLLLPFPSMRLSLGTGDVVGGVYTPLVFSLSSLPESSYG